MALSVLKPGESWANWDKLVTLSGRFLCFFGAWSSQVEESEPGGGEVWRDNLEENKVTMTLSEHLSIYPPLAYKEIATTELHNLIFFPLYNLIFESHKNVMESNSGSYTYFKD